MISVALCTYNGDKFIREQLDSILAQSLPVDEIVVCDDCSNDSTCSILESYAKDFSQIRLIRNEYNVGFRKNFENALMICQGDYIFFSDQDDVWAEKKVEIMVDYLNASGMYGVYTDGRLINQSGDELGETLFSRLKLLPYIENNFLDEYEFEIACLNGNHVTGATLAITKSAKELIIPFRTTDLLLHDMWIALKLSSIHKLGRFDQCLISYRMHTTQECGLNMENNNDLLIDCFSGRGKCSDLLQLRWRSIAPIFFCRLNYREKMKIFKLYKTLYFKCLNGRWNFKEICHFVFGEILAFVKTTTGFGVK